MEKDIYIKLLDFGDKNQEGFSFDDIITGLKGHISDWETDIINTHIDNAAYNKSHIGSPGFFAKETMFLCIQYVSSRSQDPRNQYIINLDARFKYIDYVELKEARKTANYANKNAKKAHEQAMAAHRTAKYALFAAIVIPLVSTIWGDLMTLGKYLWHIVVVG